MTPEQQDALRDVAEQRIARLRWLADALESHWGLTNSERNELAAILRQLIEDAES